MDGHSSHYSPVALKMAAEDNVILFALPPNTTHLSQPLDKGVFGPLKVAWRRVCHTYLSENPGIVVTRCVFSQLLNSVWHDSMTSKNIIAGFRTTGVYPTDRYAITLPGETKKGKSLHVKPGCRSFLSTPLGNRPLHPLSCMKKMYIPSAIQKTFPQALKKTALLHCNPIQPWVNFLIHQHHQLKST